MKQLNKTLFLIVLFATIGTMNAQSELIADNTAYSPSNIASLYKSDDKITISDFMPNLTNNSTLVSVKCLVPLTVQVKVFSIDGNMAKAESHSLDKGVSEINVDINDLAAGSYMIQFYTKEGSAVRRFVKTN